MPAFWLSVIALAFLIIASIPIASTDYFNYGFECQNGRCVKVEISEVNFAKAKSLPLCKMFCNNALGTVWPKPSGPIKVDSVMLQVDITSIDFHVPPVTKQSELWEANKERFLDQISAKIPNINVLNKGWHTLYILITTMDAMNTPRLTLDTDESYKLSVKLDSEEESRLIANITANNYFGARHGLETLSQLIVYDNIHHEVVIAAKVEIEDGPQYKWRGLLLDTSRNFYSTKAIKRTLDAMAMVKLNTFHWHMTDSQSFPLEVKKQKDLYELGAYSPNKVYTHEDIRDVVKYALIRGIRVMPEFDAPAHIGEGWQHKNMTACLNAQPWNEFCDEPPCGQLDPTVENLYPVLEDIYSEIFELFDPDVFHMGGDEVSISCWNSCKRIRDWMKARGWGHRESDFLRLWGYFQSKALNRIDQISKTQIPIILWTSRLTEEPFIDEYLDNERYIIQIWSKGFDPKVQEVLKRGFRVIISNNDALYFDCGGASWVSDGNNWCSPYIGWQKVYENRLENIAGKYHHNVLGAEAAVWSEQIDEFTLDSRFWPRGSALAERLWSNPPETWREAESRILLHRARLVENGIGAEAMQPEWCLQNENECPVSVVDEKPGKLAPYEYIWLTTILYMWLTNNLY